jgi:hypothetical protein
MRAISMKGKKSIKMKKSRDWEKSPLCENNCQPIKE